MVLLILKSTLVFSEEIPSTASELLRLSSLLKTGSWLMNLLSPLGTLFSVSTMIYLNSVQILAVEEGSLLCLWLLTFLQLYGL